MNIQENNTIIEDNKENIESIKEENKKENIKENNNLILDKEKAYFIWYASWLSLITAIYAIYQKHYFLVLVPLGVFLTSINYWHEPDYSWRRNLDIGYVFFALIYQSYHALYSSNCFSYFIFITMALLCFPFGWYYYNNGDLWISIYIHSGMHLFGNIANIILYSGYFIYNNIEVISDVVEDIQVM